MKQKKVYATRECENLGGRTEPESEVSPCAQVRFRFGTVDWVRKFQPNVAAVIDVKTDLSTQDLVT